MRIHKEAVRRYNEQMQKPDSGFLLLSRRKTGKLISQESPMIHPERLKKEDAELLHKAVQNFRKLYDEDPTVYYSKFAFIMQMILQNDISEELLSRFLCDRQFYFQSIEIPEI